MPTTRSPLAELPSDPAALGSRLAGRPLLVLLDVDGTLAPIAPRPEDATVPAATRAAVAALAALDGVHVALVSGRGAADAGRLVGVPGAWAIGNHGLEVMSPDGAIERDPSVAEWDGALRAGSDAAAPIAAAVPGALLEDKGATLSVHYRSVNDANVPLLQRAIEGVAASFGLRLTHGRRVFELRPPVSIDKGTAVLALAARLGVNPDSGSALFAGDDATDEDAMGALRAWLPRAVTIRVSGENDARPSCAEWRVGSPRALGGWLAALARWREGVAA